MARTKTKDKHGTGKRPGLGPDPLLVTALKKENQRLLQRIAILEILCTTAQSRIKILEKELDPHAPEKLINEELETVLHAFVETNRPLRHKRRHVKKPD